MISREEQRIVSYTMCQHGGDFVHALGMALGRADEVNAQKIRDAFPELWDKHIDLACAVHLWHTGHASEQDVSGAQLEAENAAASH